MFMPTTRGTRFFWLCLPHRISPGAAPGRPHRPTSAARRRSSASAVVSRESPEAEAEPPRSLRWFSAEL